MHQPRPDALGPQPALSASWSEFDRSLASQVEHSMALPRGMDVQPSVRVLDYSLYVLDFPLFGDDSHSWLSLHPDALRPPRERPAGGPTNTFGLALGGPLAGQQRHDGGPGPAAASLSCLLPRRPAGPAGGRPPRSPSAPRWVGRSVLFGGDSPRLWADRLPRIAVVFGASGD